MLFLRPRLGYARVRGYGRGADSIAPHQNHTHKVLPGWSIAPARRTVIGVVGNGFFEEGGGDEGASFLNDGFVFEVGPAAGHDDGEEWGVWGVAADVAPGISDDVIVDEADFQSPAEGGIVVVTVEFGEGGEDVGFEEVSVLLEEAVVDFVGEFTVEDEAKEEPDAGDDAHEGEVEGEIHGMVR